MSKDWVNIYASQKVHKIEITKAILEDHNIKVFQINKTDSMHVHLASGEIELYVESKDVIKAKHLIDKHKL